MASTSIYILRLQNGKYYVGKSDNPYKRYQEHLEGRGSAWTQRNRPVEVVKVIQGVSPFDEDKYTKEYMSRYGVENVRGGSYSSLRLDDVQEEALERELRGAQDACMRCGRPGHFARDCYARTEVKQMPKKDEDGIFNTAYDAFMCHSRSEQFTQNRYAKNEVKKGSVSKSAVTCYRCERVGHYASQCYARTFADGESIDEDSDEDDGDDDDGYYSD